MRRTLATWVVAGLIGTTTGCPARVDSAPAPQSLRLSVNEPAPPKVGERRGFTVSYGPNGEQLMSALIANENGPCLTKWHAEPADAVQFEANGAAATFKREGPVKIWATVKNADGTESKSNAIEVSVSK